MTSITDNEETLLEVLNKLLISAGLLSKHADRVFNSEISIPQSQFAVLLIIDSIKPPVKQSEVAIQLKREFNTVSNMIERLVKSGLVKRTRSESNHRENYLALTKEGQDKLVKGNKSIS